MSADIQVDGELTIVRAAAQREQWLGWLAETAAADPASWPAVTLDLSAVEAVDSAGVQLLLALQHSLAGRGQALRLHAASACVHDALQHFGLAARLPLAQEVAP
jgi:anti-sigma B factor antagonist